MTHNSCLTSFLKLNVFVLLIKNTDTTIERYMYVFIVFECFQLYISTEDLFILKQSRNNYH